MLSDWALREGILLDYIHGHPRSLARAEAYPDVGRRRVVSRAERGLYDEPHARHGAGRAVVIASLQLRLSVLFRAGPKRREPSPTFERFERREQKLLITSVVPIHQRAVNRLDPD